MSRLAVLLCGVLAVGVGCGRSNDEETVTVLAASSLTDAFERVEAAFEETHPDIDVVITFASSSTLAAQIAEGAPVDVFAAADAATMDRAVATDAVADPVVFATNTLTIVVERGNPRGITGLADLADDSLVLVLAAPEAPVGRYTDEVLRRAGVDVQPDAFAPDARAVLAKVALGEADAGIVFATDPRDEPAAEPVAIAVVDNVLAEYPIAVASGGAEAARQFVEFVVGTDGQAILGDEGFGTVP